jgi:HD-GYP domain-containing protein (c-di-GMP phosphodiesterase class II)
MRGSAYDEAEELCSLIRQSVEDYNNTSFQFPLSVSLGFAVANTANSNPYELLKTADNNMYREKLLHGQSIRSNIVQIAMKALGERDFVTEGHAERLRTIVSSMLIAYGHGKPNSSDMILLAEFHDIGKVGIPDHILFKPGPLTDDEYKEMQRHCEIGQRIALSSPDLAPIANFILNHHERWDGNGYPLRLKGEEIPLACRILAIADSYDAMTSDRPYRTAMSHQDALEEINRCSGSQFDPNVVDVFMRQFSSCPL